MKAIDKILRYWRVKVALNNGPKSMNSVFDIGCNEGYLLRKLAPITKKQDGIDPRLSVKDIGNISEVKKGFFPASIEADQMNGSYDAIFSLAVFEHFTEVDIRESASVISKMLSDNGRLVVTAPHPFVDKILDILMWLRLIDGQALEEHHEFNPESLLSYFSGSLKLVKKQKFQFGLNTYSYLRDIQYNCRNTSLDCPLLVESGGYRSAGARDKLHLWQWRFFALNERHDPNSLPHARAVHRARLADERP